MYSQEQFSIYCSWYNTANLDYSETWKCEHLEDKNAYFELIFLFILSPNTVRKTSKMYTP